VDSTRPDEFVAAERAPRAPAHVPLPAGAEHEPPSVAGRLPSALGNRGFGGILARMRGGEGIMPGGLVHPDVEAAIALAQGGGRTLDTGVARQIEPTLGTALDDVRVHTGSEADVLARAVAARAFTVGNDIFFGAGEYRPGTADGDRLIAHEAAHVVQQRGAPASGPLTVSQPGDALEREAEALARGIPG